MFQVVQGAREAVEAILAHPDIAAISFVGSTAIAETIYRGGTSHGKRVQALGGAKNHLVVMPDADIDDAVDALMGSAYGAAGERCMAVSVAVAVGSAGDALVRKLEPRVRALKIGPGTDPDAEMGPLVTREHREKVQGYIDLGVKEGAKLVVDGRGLSLQGYENGYLPRRLAVRQRQHRHAHLQARRFSARCWAWCARRTWPARCGWSTRMSTATALRSSPRTAARRAISPTRIKIGMVGVNVPIPVPMAFHSFGGWKHSLFGDHHIYGPEGVRFYTRYKAITQRWPTGARRGAEYVMPTLGR